MSEPRKRTPAELGAAIERVGDEAKLARVDALSEVEVDAELRAAGIAPEDAAAAGEEALGRPGGASAPKPARPPPGGQLPLPAKAALPSQPLLSSSRPPRPPRITWVAWLAAAALAGLFAVALMRHNDNVAAPRPADATPPLDQAHRDQAAQIRADATAACAQSQWQRCGEKLDAARAIDPAGESDPRILRLRAAVRDATRPR